jgi:predicted membrane protein
MAGGGISVIIGTSLVIARLHKLGKLIISLGTGMGLIGLIIFLLIETTLINPIETGSDLGFFILRLLIDFYFIGVLLTIFAKRKMKVISKEPEEKKYIEQFLPQEKTGEITNKIKCPACKEENNDYEIYCQYCGTALKYNLESHL